MNIRISIPAILLYLLLGAAPAAATEQEAKSVPKSSRAFIQDLSPLLGSSGWIRDIAPGAEAFTGVGDIALPGGDRKWCAYVWTRNKGLRELPAPENGFYPRGMKVSDDAGVVAGYAAWSQLPKETADNFLGIVVWRDGQKPAFSAETLGILGVRNLDMSADGSKLAAYSMIANAEPYYSMSIDAMLLSNSLEDGDYIHGTKYGTKEGLKTAQEEGMELTRPRGGRFEALSGDGRHMLITGGPDGNYTINLDTLEKVSLHLKDQPFEDNNGRVSSLLDPKLIRQGQLNSSAPASGSGRLLAYLGGHELKAVSINHDGSLVLGSITLHEADSRLPPEDSYSHKFAVLWDNEGNMEFISTEPLPTRVAPESISADGKTAMFAGDGKIFIWRRGHGLQRLEQLLAEHGVEASPILAAGPDDEPGRLFQAKMSRDGLCVSAELYPPRGDRRVAPIIACWGGNIALIPMDER